MMYKRDINRNFFKILYLLIILLLLSCGEDDSSPTGTNFTNSLTDIDGNKYPLVTIGTQVWMAKNLKVTKYRDGSDILKITDETSWQNTRSGAYTSYDTNDVNIEGHGLLYNWYAVNSSIPIAPEGWHIPTENEWQTLIDSLGGGDTAVNKLQERIGFAVLFSGYLSYTSARGFDGLGQIAGFWCSTGASGVHGKTYIIDVTQKSILNISRNKHDGYSIRCIKD